jgi:spermidine/putrescine transport system permease protein
MEAIAPLTIPTANRRARRRRPDWFAWLAFTPLALWLVLLVAAPTLMLIAFSFCDTDPDLGEPIAKFTWDNYRAIFEPAVWPMLWHAGVAGLVGGIVLCVAARRFSAAAIRWGFVLGGGGCLSYAVRHLPDGVDLAYAGTFWRSVEMAGLATGLCLVIGYPVAFFIGRAEARWRDRLLLLVMIPFWTSFLIRTYAWVMILNQNGLLNAGLRGLHLAALIPESGAFLYTPSAVVLGLVYAYLPFMILPIYGSVEKLDGTLIEASLDLGAGPLRTLARVVLPLTAPGIAAGVVLVFVPAIGMYAISTLLGGGRAPMIGDVINNQFNAANNQPQGAALGVVLMASFGLVFLITGFRKVDAG